MKKLIGFFLITIFIFSIISCFAPAPKEDGIYARFNTNMGKMFVKLNYEKSPLSAANFIGLSEGTIDFTDYKTGDKVKRPFYDGLIFHRVIKDERTQECMIIQGGCPAGDGSGNPGYTFADEVYNDLKFDSAGILAMASSSPNTNGSQFFFTLAAIPSLNGKYSIFGNVVSGYDTLEKIGKVKTDANNKPFKEVYVKNIKIIRIGEKAKAFNAVFELSKKDEVLKKNKEEAERRREELLKTLGVDENKITAAKSGLKYFVKKYGSGKMPASGSLIIAHYTGYLTDGTVFDSSYERNSPIEVQIGVGKVIKGWDEAFLTMREGEKRVLIIPYYLGYGDYGMPPVIPPQAALIFDVELISVK